MTKKNFLRGLSGEWGRTCLKLLSCLFVTKLLTLPTQPHPHPVPLGLPLSFSESIFGSSLLTIGLVHSDEAVVITFPGINTKPDGVVTGEAAATFSPTTLLLHWYCLLLRHFLVSASLRVVDLLHHIDLLIHSAVRGIGTLVTFPWRKIMKIILNLTKILRLKINVMNTESF